MHNYRLMPPPEKVAKRDEGLLKAYNELRKKALQLAMMISAEFEARKYGNNMVVTNPAIKDAIREIVGDGLELVMEPDPYLQDLTVTAKRSKAQDNRLRVHARKLVFAIAGCTNGGGPTDLLTKRDLAKLRKDGVING